MADPLTACLRAAQSADPSARKAAEQQLAGWEAAGAAPFLGQLVVHLADEGRPPDTRRLAGLLLKNAVSAEGEGQRAEKAARWRGLDAPTQAAVRAALLATLSSPVRRPARAPRRAASAEAAPARPRPDGRREQGLWHAHSRLRTTALRPARPGAARRRLRAHSGPTWLPTDSAGPLSLPHSLSVSLPAPLPPSPPHR